MKKNYFMKNVLAAMMLLAVSMSMTSCQGFVDAVFGSEDNPTEKPSKPQDGETTIKVTADETTITISSTDDLDEDVIKMQAEKLAKAIETKAEAGETYTITIKSEETLDAENFGFEIPRVDGADINLVFDCNIESSEDAPLEITADKKNSETSTTAVNELTVTFPDGSDDVYLSLDLPETTVTLDGDVTYHYVEANTATNTLIVTAHILIKSMHVKGGTVVVDEDASIETLVAKGDVYLAKDGIVLLDSKGKPIVSSGNDPYYFKKVKAADGETLIINYDVNSGILDELIIGEKATASCYIEDTEENKEVDIQIKNVIGEGNGTGVFYTPVVHAIVSIEKWDEENGMPFFDEEGYPIMEEIEEDHARIKKIDKISNVELTTGHDGIEIYNTILENVTTSVIDAIFYSFEDMMPSSNSITIKRCKFNEMENIYLLAPRTTKSLPSINIIFNDCEFNRKSNSQQHSFTMQTWGWVDDDNPADENEHVFTFTDCKNDGKLLSSLSFETLKEIFVEGGSTPEIHENTPPGQAGKTHTILLDIDGKYYTFVGNWGDEENPIRLEKIVEE